MRARVPTVWNDNYHTLASGTILSTRKQKVVMDRAMALGLVDVRDVPFNADHRDAERVHAPDYVRALLTGQPRSLAESQGITCSKDLARAVFGIWNGHRAACELALTEGLHVRTVQVMANAFEAK